MQYIPDQYKIQQKYESVFLQNPIVLKLIPDNFKTEKMCEKALDRFPFVFK